MLQWASIWGLRRIPLISSTILCFLQLPMALGLLGPQTIWNLARLRRHPKILKVTHQLRSHRSTRPSLKTWTLLRDQILSLRRMKNLRILTRKSSKLTLRAPGRISSMTLFYSTTTNSINPQGQPWGMSWPSHQAEVNSCSTKQLTSNERR